MAENDKRGRGGDPFIEGERRAPGVVLDGGSIRARRLELGLTQKALAGKVDLSKSRVSRIELDQGGKVRATTAQRLAGVLSMDLESLVIEPKEGTSRTVLPEDFRNIPQRRLLEVLQGIETQLTRIADALEGQHPSDI